MIIKPNTAEVLDITCPSCKSNNTQSFSMIYQSGTSVGFISGIGVDGDGGIGMAGGRRVSRTLLAQKVSPPSSRFLYPVVGFIVVVGGAFVSGAAATYIIRLLYDNLWAPLIGFCVAIVIGVLAIKVVYDGYMKYSSEYERQVDRWLNSWMCLRCGHSWIPSLKRTASV